MADHSELNEKAPATNNEETLRESKGERPWWSEAVKDVTLTGLATLFMTEESVRNYLKEKKLPKELVSLVLDNITKRKDDIYELIAKEVGRMLSKSDLSREVTKFLETHELNLRVTFKKRDGEDV